jgi:hypothetical protein
MTNITVRHSGRSGISSVTVGDTVRYQHECSGELTTTPDNDWAELITVQPEPVQDDPALRAAVDQDLRDKGIQPLPSKPRKRSTKKPSTDSQ